MCTITIHSMVDILTQENEMLRVAIFNLSMPKFEDVVLCYNDSLNGPQCRCEQCQYLGLIRENWDGGTENRCRLWTAWEHMLSRLNITYDNGASPSYQGIYVNLCSPGREHCQHHNSICNTDTLKRHMDSSLQMSNLYSTRESQFCMTQLYGKWTAHMQIVASWGSPILNLQDGRIALWQSLWDEIERLNMQL